MEINPKMLVFTDGYRIYQIPWAMAEGLKMYIDQRIRQGSFLHAVLCNDLIEACRRADLNNLGNLPAYAHFLTNFAPPQCYGSQANVEAWLKGK